MTQKIESFYNSLKGKKVAFIGAGVSHKECIKIFCKKGAIVTLCDKKSEEDFGDYGRELKAKGVTFSTGENYLDGLKNQDMIMRTPGFEFFTKELVEAGEDGSEITSEMELFFTLCPCKIYAVTGSDGKTTTTTLISEMLKAQGKTVHLGGNIGRALLPIIDEINSDDVAVVELSSFQLISMKHSPDVAVVTNVTPNHLDHHKDMQEYIDAKRNILLYQSENSRTILGYENETSKNMQSDVKGECTFFSRLNEMENGACLDDENNLCIAKNGILTKIVNASEVLLPGLHNIENLLCAMASVEGEVSHENMKKVATTFTGVEHRIEPVRTLNGVKWYNDSIASSPTRTIAGLKSFNQKLILIAGGYDKKIPYEPLAPHVIEHVKILILMGQTADAIEIAIKNHCDYNASDLTILRCDNMEQAVSLAFENAKGGDVVTMSPASASFDFYPNFEVRGKHYKDLVNAL